MKNKQNTQEIEKAQQELIQLFKSSNICANKAVRIKQLLQIPNLYLSDIENEIDWDECLSLLVRGNCSEILAMLVPYLPSKHIFAQDEQGHTPLIHAAINNHTDIVKLFLQTNPTIDDICLQDNLKKTALTHAALYGHIDVVTFLLETGITANQINTKNSEGFTPLMDAAYAGNLDMVKLLLTRLATKHILAQNDDGYTAADLAAQQNHPVVVSSLLNVLHEKTCNEALLPILKTIAERNNADMLLHLISSGVTDEQLNLEHEPGWTPLMIAAAHGADDVVKILVKHSNREQINAFTIDGKTAIVYAIELFAIESVKQLIDAGASLDCIDIGSDTPLMAAALRGEAETVKLLLDTGLSYDDITACTNYGKTALMYAAESDDQKTVQLFLDAGLKADDITRIDSDGTSALDYAESDSIKRLIQARLDELTERA